MMKMKNDNMRLENTVTMRVGDSFIVNDRTYPFTVSVMYAGMPSWPVFSLLFKKTIQRGHTGHGHESCRNMFYQMANQKITDTDLPGFLQVTDVGPESITLEHYVEKPYFVM